MIKVKIWEDGKDVTIYVNPNLFEFVKQEKKFSKITFVNSPDDILYTRESAESLVKRIRSYQSGVRNGSKE
jgi:hypothetical protein